MSQPRFTVGSVTGYPITTVSISRASSSRTSTAWYVQDTSYCHQTVAHVTGKHAEQRARRIAERLNGGAYRAPQTPKDFCKNGHPFDELNTYLYADGTRKCRACRAATARARTARRAA